MSDTVSMDLISTRLLEAHAEMRGLRGEMRMMRGQIASLEGRLIDALNDRLGGFEVRLEDQLGRFQSRMETMLADIVRRGA